jgi:hypothetical protein
MSFLKFEEMILPKNAKMKTKVFRVSSLHDGSYLGQVYWRNGWRRYIMHFDNDCDWSIECMAECYKFCQLLMQNRSKPSPSAGEGK